MVSYMTYLYLTLTQSKGQGQGRVHCENEYLVNDDRYVKNYYCHQAASHIWTFDCHIYI